MFRYIALLVVSIVAAVTGNESTCGPTRPSPVPFCDKPDMGSCGNACCVVDVELPSKPDDVYATTHSWLKSEGTDRSFTYVTGPNKAGQNPGDDLRPYNISWLWIFQGTHTTTKGYVDTINFNIQKGKGGSGTLMRVANLANIHGALGDNGQSYKTIHYLLSAIYPESVKQGISLVFGCGQTTLPFLNTSQY
eukprot:m.60913 g.60913  ORF g.60913 m.60913 type:complete len:192 (+) comp9531_c0_seq4:106-681(+)